MNELAIICRYGKAHNLTYGRVVDLMSIGKLTREEIGLPPLDPVPPQPKKAAEKKKQTVRRQVVKVGGKLSEKS